MLFMHYSVWSLYSVLDKLESFTTSKFFSFIMSKVRQRISVIPENWHFNSRFVLKTTKTPVFVFITEIL